MIPTEVKLWRTDGTVLNCELLHQGVDEEGIDQWVIAGVEYRYGDHITINELPPKTAVSFALPKGMDPNSIRITADDTSIKSRRFKKPGLLARVIRGLFGG